MGRHLASTGLRVVGRSHRLQHHRVVRHPERQAQSPIAVVQIEPVLSGPEQGPGRRLYRLVPRAGDLEENLVLPLELDLLVVDPARGVDVTVHIEEDGSLETANGTFRLGFGIHGSQGTIRPLKGSTGTGELGGPASGDYIHAPCGSHARHCHKRPERKGPDAHRRKDARGRLAPRDRIHR